MTWHYRVSKRKDPLTGKAYFGIVEYFAPNGIWTEEHVKPFGNTRKELIQDLETMLSDAKRHRTHETKRR
jgi:hypothetical protein